MSTKPNHRRGEPRSQDNGPTWEGSPPSSGCNSTHVARARTKWKRRINRLERRSGAVEPFIIYGPRERPPLEADEE